MAHGPFKNTEARSFHWYTALKPEICNRLEHYEHPELRVEILHLIWTVVRDTGGVLAWRGMSEEWRLDLLAAFTGPELERTLFYS